MTLRGRQALLVCGVFFLVVCLDQLAKALIMISIPENSVSFSGHEREIVFLRHVRNPGLVGGMFASAPVMAYTAPIVASFVLIFLFRNLDPVSKLQAISFGMIAGGAAGNLIDRIQLGEVVDYIQVHFYFIPFDFPWKQYPTFNIADSAICVGVAILILSWHRHEAAHVPDRS